jgi:hypothetical protein
MVWPESQASSWTEPPSSSAIQKFGKGKNSSSLPLLLQFRSLEKIVAGRKQALSRKYKQELEPRMPRNKSGKTILHIDT